MTSEQVENSHLTVEQRCLIKYNLSLGMTPEKIVEEWNVEYHGRVAPSLRTVYSIKKQIQEGDSVLPKTAGPKTRVLTDEKLNEIEDLIEEDEWMTNEQLAIETNMPKSTANLGLKILEYKKFEAAVSPSLSISQMKARLSFCETFLCWNIKHQMNIWWSDESSLNMDSVCKHQTSSYNSKVNKHKSIEKKIEEKPSMCGVPPEVMEECFTSFRKESRTRGSIFRL